MYDIIRPSIICRCGPIFRQGIFDLQRLCNNLYQEVYAIHSYLHSGIAFYFSI